MHVSVLIIGASELLTIAMPALTELELPAALTPTDVETVSTKFREFLSGRDRPPPCKPLVVSELRFGARVAFSESERSVSRLGKEE